MMFFVHIPLVFIVVTTCLLKTCRLQTVGDVRLFRGDEQSVGIVQLYSNNTWYTICGHGFDSVAANVVCIQLGFASGSALPIGAFGEFNEIIPYPEQYQGCSTGIGRLSECSFGGINKCTPHRLAYANVKCSNDFSQTPDTTVILDSSKEFPESGYLSPISVYSHGTWGHVCGQYWDDSDASVVCRQLNFSGGVVAYGKADLTTPILVTNIQCIGNETQWESCVQNHTFCYNEGIGSVFCYQNVDQGPTFSLVGGKSNYGTVVVTVDGHSGLICNSSYHEQTVEKWSFSEAYVICESLGYNGGYVLEGSYDTGDINEVFLEGISCDTGEEGSLFLCKHHGWKNITSNCQNKDMAVSVYCYKDVRLLDRDWTESEDLLIGRVEINSESGWHALCADMVTQKVANITCREFGFIEAEILLPGSFDFNRYYESISNITCTGTENSISECSFTFGSCVSHSYHAAIACRHSTTNNGITVLSLDDSYYGEVNIKRHGLEGHICLDGWDDTDASVLCRQIGNGHHSGIALVNSPPYYTANQIWATQFSCDGTESELTECVYHTNMSYDWHCADDSYVAGVLCFLNAVPDTLVRLADGRSAGHGRAEVYNDVSGWGTICNSRWGNEEAAVFCKQAGYADGQSHPSPWRTDAAEDVPIVLSRVDCDGTETSIFECGNRGWLSSSPCTSHSTDAGVYCYSFVELMPGSNYGAVKYHTGEEYGLVCADGFDNNAATVVCKEKGFPFGMTLCCSALGNLGLEFSMTDVNCIGNEKSLTDCQFNEGNLCAGGQYASVYCNYIPATTYVKWSTNPVLKVQYYSMDGFVCSEKFTHADANVVCRQINGLNYGKAYKASAIYYKNQVRWLNGLGCEGNELSISECGTPDWGQIGICSWDSVAAVICSNTEGDLDFEARIVNGSETEGRLEIKINGEWGTIDGTHLTRQEAHVICREIGFHGGINLKPGSYGKGTGNVLLTSISCTGDESSVEDCVWSGYSDNSGQRDHAKDAAVNCFYNTQLVGSTIDNYGRLEMYDSTNDMWYAVCDSNLDINNARIICQQMGYVNGMFQKGSAVGYSSSPISIVSINCSQTSECTFTMGTCFSETYLTLYCHDQPIVYEGYPNVANLDLKLPLSSYYGPVSVRRFGLWGHVCSVGFGDSDAQVVCSQLGFSSGTALQTFNTSGYPIIQGNVQCSGDEDSFYKCSRGLFAEATGCYDVNTVAGVMCSDASGVSFKSANLDHETGVMSVRVGISVNGGNLYVSATKFSDLDAWVYCNSLGYAGGEAYPDGFGSFSISDLSCIGTEENILQCPATWDPEKNKDQTSSLAGVKCYTAVRLLNGDPTFYGAVIAIKGVDAGLVCEDNFNTVDAGAVCRTIGLQKGLVLCCAPFGTIEESALITNVSCPGWSLFGGDHEHRFYCMSQFNLEPLEKQKSFHGSFCSPEPKVQETTNSFTQCSYDRASGNKCQRNYAAVVCYNGQKPTDYTLTLETSSSYSGNLVVTYLGVNGSICMDGWDDDDAHVACRELGYSTGIAYNAARENEAPFWISDVDCSGSEESLSQCTMTSFGDVKSCTNQLSHAGVLCYDFDGLFARLSGSGESRYGRVEILIDGRWQSLCNTHWDNDDAHVTCKMLGYRAGEAFYGKISENITGPVMGINFMCSGEENSLTECVSSGWRASTSVDCAFHKNDAGAFCYKSVKLSTGVGRETDQGAVLLYRNNTWYSVCADGFTQQSASVVCKELGFRDGQVQTGSKYGPLQNYPRLVTHKMSCTGEETDAYNCLVKSTCGVTDYASVVCYEFQQATEEPINKEPEETDVLPIIIGVCVAVAVIIIFLIVFAFWRKRKSKDSERMSFDDTIVRQSGDGSVHVSNPLQQTPEISRVQYDNRNNNVYLAHSNPNYSGAQTRSDDIVGQSEPANTLSDSVLSTNNPVELQNDDPHLYDSIRSENVTPHYITTLAVNSEVSVSK